MKTIRCHLPVSIAFLAALASMAPAQVWTSHGPRDAGSINDLVVVDGTAYAATPNGVFRSSDRGASWQAAGLPGLSVSRISGRSGALAVFALVFGAWPSSNLYVSNDAGQTWTSVPGQDSVVAIGIDPERLSTAYFASANDGSIWRSTDAGVSWQQVSTLPANASPRALVVGSNAIYVLTYDNLYKSADEGRTWTSVQPPGNAGASSTASIAVGSAAGVVYAAGTTGFCRSADSASTWTCAATPADSISRILEIPTGGSATPSLLAATFEGVLLSKDRGATWALAGSGSALQSSLSAALASDASGSLVLAGTGSKAFRSLDRGETWTPESTGLNSVWIGALALDPSDPSAVWAGGTANDSSGPGLFHSINAGLAWSPASGPEGASGPRNVYCMAIDPDHSTTMYVGENAVFRTDDGGQTWATSEPTPSGSLSALAVDPDAPQRVLAGTGSGLFRSEDGASTWVATTIAQSVYSLLFDDRLPGTVYATSYWAVDADYGYGTTGGSIFFSYDHGATFTKGTHEFPDTVLSVARDPFHDATLYAGTATAGVFRSEDAGATWEGSSQGLPNPAAAAGLILYSPVFQLAADPVRSDYLYAATQGGVSRTIDGARTWQPFSTGLAPQATGMLSISPDGQKLYAGTEGGGVFEIDLETAASPSVCTASPSRLCLVGSRYAVDLIATLPGSSTWTAGAARSLGDRSGYFGLPFATGDPDLPEVVVKMLPQGELGSAAAPVFYSSLTNLPYYLTVTDTVTGERRSYASKPGSPLCGGVDIPPEPPGASASPHLALKAGEAALSLIGGRFSVALDARRPGSAASIHGAAMASGDRFGFFSLPEVTGDPQFPEIVVKMIDGRAANGEFWFFQTGLTSLAYTLTVTDSVTGEVQTYESATPFCGDADTRAFPMPGK